MMYNITIMTKEEFNKYVERFPKSTQQALSYKPSKMIFLSSVRTCYAPIRVYRAVKNSDNFCSNDFITMPEERKMTFEKITKRLERDKNFTIKSFGVSVNEDIDNMIASVKYPSERHKGIVVGVMSCENGVADFEEGKTHHNWYIFQDRMDDVVRSFRKYEYN